MPPIEVFLISFCIAFLIRIPMYRKITLQLWLMLAAIPFAYPQSGMMVPSFGKNGITEVDFGQPGTSNDWGEIVKTDADGKIWIAGSSSNGNNYDFSIVRLNPDGNLDSTFGEYGKLLIPVGNGDDRAYGLDLGIHGKIKLIGRSDVNFSVVQLNYDGSLDSTFSDEGKLIIPANSSQDNFTGLGSIVDKEGRILIAGGTHYVNQRNFLIVRLNPDGNPDNTFGTAGKLLIPVDHAVIQALNIGPYICSVAIDADDNILIAGNSYGENGMPKMVIKRIDNLGNLDENFGDHGTIEIFADDGGYANSLALDENGKILIAGVHVPGGTTNFWKYVIIRLNENGSFDNTFDNDGKAFFAIGGNDDRANSICTDGRGKIIVAGTSETVLSVLRLKTDGSPDSTFNGNGTQMIRMGQYDEARSLTLDANGKLLIAGSTFNSTNFDFAVARVNVDGEVDETFNGNGKKLIMLGNGNDEGKCMALGNNGKIWIAGSSFSENENKFSIVRLNTDGSVDKTFNGSGKRILPLGNPEYYPNFDYRGIAVDADGKVLLSGSAYNGTDDDFGIIRLDKDGIPDTTFGENGTQVIPIGEFDERVNGMQLLSNGKILLFGLSFNSVIHYNDSVNGCIIRLSSDGTLDKTFNESGKLIFPNVVVSKCLQAYPDGKLLFAAFHANVGSWENSGGLILLQLNEEGNLVNVTEVPSIISLTDVLIDVNQKILVLGGYGDRGFHQLVKRFILDGRPDSTYGVNGTIEFQSSPIFYNNIRTSIVDSAGIFLAGGSINGFELLSLMGDGRIDTSFGLLGKMIQTGGYGKAIVADSNFIWMAGSANGDYKIIKLYARNFQHIDFVLPDTVKIGDPPIKLSGTASSGLPVSYMSSNPAIASISHDTLCITGPGSVTITARQDGDGSFYAADPVTEYLFVQRNITAIPTREIDKEIRAYPNPVSGILCLESTGKINSVILAGVEGTILYERTDINAHNFTFDISGYKPGFYILTIRVEDNYPEYVLKILKY